MGNIGFKKLNKIVVDPPVAYPVNVETRGCHYCKFDISPVQLLTCVRCNVKIHRYCYYSNNTEKRFTTCPRCSRIGSIGFSSEI
jgi:hypothetical protein